MRKVFPALLLALAATLSACQAPAVIGDASPSPSAAASPPPEVTTAPAAPAGPVRGGALRLSMRAPKTLNPINNTDETVDAALSLVFQKLMLLDENLKPYPNSRLVSSVEYSEDGRTVTLTLREGAAWSDGKPLSADDLIYTLDALKRAPAGAIYKSGARNVKSYDKLDSLTVAIGLVSAYSGADYDLRFPVIPAHYYGKNAPATPAPTPTPEPGESPPPEPAETPAPVTEADMNPVGIGYYTFVSYTAGEGMRLAAAELGGSRPYIPEVEVIITPDAETDYDALTAGLIDVCDGGIADWGRYTGKPDYSVYEYTTQYFDMIGFNYNNPVFADKPVREAVALCVPFDALPADYSGGASVVSIPVNPGSWLYSGDAPTAPDISRAAAILDADGWTPGESGARSKIVPKTEVVKPSETPDPIEAPEEAEAPEETAVPPSSEPPEPENVAATLSLTLIVNEENAERAAVAAGLADNMRQAGFDVLVVKLPFAQFETRLRAREFDMYIAGINMSVYPDLSFLLHSRNSKDGTNYSDLVDADLDRLLKEAFSAPIAGREEAVGAVMGYIGESRAFVPLAFRGSAVVMNSRVAADIRRVPGGLFDNVAEWYIKE
ncbi:MAG: ABC transporter substrate-binding protein [Clostridiales bacterium]|jgi:peptide/nickel transport system substrate-binding protein|nr:ABC transporter substrate-binding protein [Clostridiales bacterium]